MTMWMEAVARACWRFMLCAGLCVAAMSHAWAGWGMNDATVVYPLPQTQADTAARLAPQEPGRKGPHLSHKY